MLTSPQTTTTTATTSTTNSLTIAPTTTPQPPPTIILQPTPQMQTYSTKPNLAFESPKCPCGSRPNKDCPQHLCASCCGKLTAYCSVSSHKDLKLRCGIAMDQPPGQVVKQQLFAAVDEKKVVFLTYSGGTSPGRERKLQLIGWVHEKTCFSAQEEGDTGAKNYASSKVTSIRFFFVVSAPLPTVWTSTEAESAQFSIQFSVIQFPVPHFPTKSRTP